MSSSSEDVLIKTNVFTLDIYVFKTRVQCVCRSSWLRRIYLTWSCVFKMSSIYFQFIFKTSSRHLAKTSSRHLQDVLPRSLQNVFKTSSRRLAKMSSLHIQHVFKTPSRRLQDVFQLYHRVKLFLVTPHQYVFNTFWTRKICQGRMSEKFMVRL